MRPLLPLCAVAALLLSACSDDGTCSADEGLPWPELALEDSARTWGVPHWVIWGEVVEDRAAAAGESGDRVLAVRDDRGHVHSLHYALPPGALPPQVAPGRRVHLEWLRRRGWLNSSGAILRDAEGRLLWTQSSADFERLFLPFELLLTESGPVCSSSAGGTELTRHEVEPWLSQGGEIVRVGPGETRELDNRWSAHGEEKRQAGVLHLSDWMRASCASCVERVPDSLGVTFTTVEEAAVAYPPCSATVGCGPYAYCEYPDDSCGANGAEGRCLPRPRTCAHERQPVCTCGGVVQPSICVARHGGSDVAAEAACALPPDAFRCGSLVCDQPVCIEWASGPVRHSCVVGRMQRCDGMPGDLPAGCTCTETDGRFDIRCP